MKRLGEVIRCYRKMKDLELKELAKDMGINRTALSRLEAAEGMPGASVLVRVMVWLLNPEAVESEAK